MPFKTGTGEHPAVHYPPRLGVERPCPKCGGGRAYGPKFIRDNEGLRDPKYYITKEWLEYECTTCGYKSRERCKDAK